LPFFVEKGGMNKESMVLLEEKKKHMGVYL